MKKSTRILTVTLAMCMSTTCISSGFAEAGKVTDAFGNRPKVFAKKVPGKGNTLGSAKRWNALPRQEQFTRVQKNVKKMLPNSGLKGVQRNRPGVFEKRAPGKGRTFRPGKDRKALPRQRQFPGMQKAKQKLLSLVEDNIISQEIYDSIIAYVEQNYEIDQAEEDTGFETEALPQGLNQRKLRIGESAAVEQDSNAAALTVEEALKELYDENVISVEDYARLLALLSETPEVITE